MNLKYGPFGMRAEERYRSVPEADILQALLLFGWAFERESAVAKESTQKTLQGWINLGLPFRPAPNGGRLFDPIEVSNFLKRVGFDGRDSFLSERMIPTHQHMVTDLAESGSAQARSNGEARFVVELKRTFNLRSIASGTKLRLRTPMPLAGDYLKSIEVKPFADSVGEAQIKISPGRLEARIIASAEPEVTIGATLDVTVGIQDPRPDREHGEIDRALYLAEQEGLIVVTERIRTFAHSLAPSNAPLWETLRAFWEFINGELMFGSIHYDQVDFTAPCDWTLDAGWFDCQTGAALFVAFCRARGIPARLISGYLLYRVAPMKHYWSEVWIEGQGWTPFDFISWDLSLGGRDKSWRDRYFGHIDYRLVCERMPREFTGALGVPLPEAWFMLQSASNGGVKNNFTDFHGTPVYSDTVRVLS